MPKSGSDISNIEQFSEIDRFTITKRNQFMKIKIIKDE